MTTYDKMLYRKRVEAGVCTSCGKNKPTKDEKGRTLKVCEKCRENNQEYCKTYRARENGRLPKEMRDAVEVVVRKTRKCKSCGININVAYYYCPWCGVQAAFE